MSGPENPAPPPTERSGGAALDSDLTDGTWHRLHPLTPLLRGGLTLVVVAGLIIANLRERLLELFFPELGGVPGDPVDYVLANNLAVVALLVVLGTLVVIVGAFTLTWRFHTFRITGDDVEVRRGIVFRTHRRAPLDRVQGVNLVRPFLPRLVGLAKLEVVGAGLDSGVTLEYLGTATAEQVRRDILRLASGSTSPAQTSTAPTGAGADAGERARAIDAARRGVHGLVEGVDTDDAAPGTIVRVPPGRVVASQVLSGTTLVLITILVAVIVGAVQGTPWLIITFVPIVIGFGTYAVRGISRGLRYAILPTPDGVRITFGLFTTTTEVLPPGRVHAVEVRQPLMWRPFGWWAISVNRLSSGGYSGNRSDTAIVLPVGTADDVDAVLHLLLPDLDEHERALVGDGLFGAGEGEYTITPKRLRWMRPLSQRRNGFALTTRALLLRRGLIWRRASIVPLARMQSVSVHQGPLARAAASADIHAHVIAGPVTTTLGALDRADAVTLFEAVSAAALTAARSDRSHRWAQAPVADADGRDTAGDARHGTAGDDTEGER